MQRKRNVSRCSTFERWIAQDYPYAHLTHQHTFTFSIRRARRRVMFAIPFMFCTAKHAKKLIKLADREPQRSNLVSSPKRKHADSEGEKFCYGSYLEKTPRTLTNSSSLFLNLPLFFARPRELSPTTNKSESDITRIISLVQRSKVSLLIR